MTVALICLLIFWFIGWESIRYDQSDKEIGKNIIFTTPMVMGIDIPNTMAGDYIAEEYGTIINTKDSWENFEYWFPDVHFEEINCNDVFSVKNVFHREKHGFLSSAFSSDIKFYVLYSPKYSHTVVSRGDYENYSNYSDNTQHDCSAK